MGSEPIGYLFSVSVVAFCTLFALAPPRPRRSSPRNRSYWFGFVLNELPFIALAWLLASTLLAIGQGDIDSPVGWAALFVAILATAGLFVVIRRGLSTGPAVERALERGLGQGWRSAIDEGIAARLRRGLPWVQILLAPILMRRRDVERVANIRYGDAGRENLLDLYRNRSHPSGCPTLVHLHGGAFHSGRKNNEARPLIYRLASQGWVCVSANYRTAPAAMHPAPVIDAKRVIAWVREHGGEYGADPTVMFVSGSSAGGNLASMVALTSHEVVLQPGFEEVDTSVSGAISLYGYYGSRDSDELVASSPMSHVGPHAPPFFLAHGDRDTVVLVEDARDFVALLRDASSQPVVYAELPGGQHTFDLVHSIRFEAVVDGIEAFAAWVRSQGSETLSPRRRGDPPDAQRARGHTRSPGGSPSS